MPTPFSAMAAVAAELGGADPTSEDSVEAFYVRIFPAFSIKIREEIFSWLTSIDDAFTTEDLKRFTGKLRKRRDFSVEETAIVSGMTELDENKADFIERPVVF